MEVLIFFYYYYFIVIIIFFFFMSVLLYKYYLLLLFSRSPAAGDSSDWGVPPLLISGIYSKGRIIASHNCCRSLLAQKSATFDLYYKQNAIKMRNEFWRRKKRKIIEFHHKARCWLLDPDLLLFFFFFYYYYYFFIFFLFLLFLFWRWVRRRAWWCMCYCFEMGMFFVACQIHARFFFYFFFYQRRMRDIH